MSWSHFGDEAGATAVEYAIMVALIAVVIITGVEMLGGSVTSVFDRASAGLGDTTHIDDPEDQLTPASVESKAPGKKPPAPPGPPITPPGHGGLTPASRG